MSAGNRKFRRKPAPPPSYHAEQRARSAAAIRLSHKRRLLAEHPYCPGCCKLLDESTSTIDHVVPLSAGGPDTPSNYCLMCEPCNKEKGGVGKDWKGFNRRAAARRRRARRSGRLPARSNSDG